MDKQQATAFYVQAFEKVCGINLPVCLQKEWRYIELIVHNSRPLAFYDDLMALLMRYCSASLDAKLWAHRVAISCCGKTHLYVDMGFSDRGYVSEIFHTYFPKLAKKNQNNTMRWKKFLYRQLCEELTLPVCPTASCDECPEHKACYVL